MTTLLSCHWQTVFSFLDLGSCECVVDVFPAADSAFGASVYSLSVARKYTTKLLFATSRKTAEEQFQRYEAEGCAVEMRDVMFQLVKATQKV